MSNDRNSPSKTDLDFSAIVQRDAMTAATWFKGPASGPAQAYRDRRVLIEAYSVAMAALKQAAQHLCSNLCPSTWPTATGPPPHSLQCQAIRQLFEQGSTAAPESRDG